MYQNKCYSFDIFNGCCTLSVDFLLFSAMLLALHGPARWERFCFVYSSKMEANQMQIFYFVICL